MKTFLGRVLAVIVGIGLIVAFLFFIMSAFVAFFSKDDAVTVKDNSVFTIKLDKNIIESDMELTSSLFNIGEKPSPNLLSLLKAIENAETDDKIKGISLELDMMKAENEELSQIELIRNKLIDFKKSGKFVYAYTNRVGQKNYYLATVADSIFHNPLGMIELKGLSTEVMFFKNLGEKYGVEFEIIRHGDYKSAVEPFMRDDLSPENREQLTQMVSQIWNKMAGKMADSRNIPLKEFNSYTDSLTSFIAENAQKNKLVDILSHESDYHDFLKQKLKIDHDDKLNSIELNEYATLLKSNYNLSKIAVLYANGMIMPGDGLNGIQSETYKKAIKEIAKNKNVKALVIRVNSGGGDANTSEEILHELKSLNKDIPIVVSFGELAASGGYYIAQASEKIYAEPFTITGSIGVLGMVPNIKGLSQNVGITTDYVQSNANTVYYSPFKGMTPQAISVITNATEDVYKKFIGHVSKNRKMSIDSVDSLGGGRIYTGMEAVENGLVDELGTLEDAINFAAKEADIEDYELKNYPIKKNDLESLLKELNISTEVKSQIKNSMDSDLLKMYLKIEEMKKMKGVQALFPYDFKLN